LNTDLLSVQLLGGVSLSWNGKVISNEDSRSKKSWLLISYLIYNRSRSVSQRELIRALWESEEKNTNPYNALKTLLHRTRSFIGQLEEGLGHRLITFRDGFYSIGPDLSISCDIDDFEDAIVKAKRAQQGNRADLLKDALAKYTGDFLSSFSLEQWVIPISVHYHDMFIEAATEAASLLYENERFEESRDVCLQALSVEPYDEVLHLCLLKSYEALDDKQSLKEAYEKMKDLLYATFGTVPQEEASLLYRSACSTLSENTMTIETVMEQMEELPFEPESEPGPTICDYDLFKLVYRVSARQLIDSGDSVHIALISIGPRDERPLAKRSLEKAMNNLEKDISSALSPGDVASRCSSSQFVLMLSHMSYEAAVSACRKLSSAFQRKYPHSPAGIRYEIRPMVPKT